MQSVEKEIQAGGPYATINSATLSSDCSEDVNTKNPDSERSILTPNGEENTLALQLSHKFKLSVALALVLGGIVAFILLTVLLARVSELQTTIEGLHGNVYSLRHPLSPQATTTG